MGGATRFLMLLSSPFPLLSARPSLFRLARHSRVIFPLHLTFSPSSPNRTFHFNSRRFHAQSAPSALYEDNSFSSDQSISVPGANTAHPWPQWSDLVNSLKRNGYFERIDYNFDDGFVNIACLSSEFVTVSKACLQLAREKDNLLGLLSRRDIEVLVENGSAFLFSDAVELKRRMKLFLGMSESSVLESDRGSMADLMKFLLCYANNHPPTSARNYQVNENDVELSVRNLLSQLVSLCFGAQESSFSGYMEKQSSDEYSQSTRPYGQRTEMKRGDWICPKCNFLNFARNMKCLECEVSRPKRQLSGGEWECPQCDFFNYGKNVVCLRCDCKRPGEVSFNTTSGNLADKIDLNSRLAANEEKAQRWFSKVSQLDSASDVADEDFPEIMPLRKGVNRFVVSTRKTPLERRLANAQYRKNLGNDGIDEGHDQQMGVADNNIDARVSRTLDEILGRNSAVATDDKDSTSGQNAGIASPSRVSANSRGGYSGSVPFVPLPSDMFAKKPEDSITQENQKLVGDNSETVVSDNDIPTSRLSKSNVFGNAGDNLQLSEKPVIMTENKDKEKEEAEKSERWFKRVAELQDVSDLASEIPDEDFPDIMPMRKGENRFVVSKKKDRSLTSPLHKRRMAMEQATSTNFVPFVPFPPGYFAKKENQNSESADSSEASQTSASSVTVDNYTQESNQVPPKIEHQQSSSDPWNSRPSGEILPGRNSDTGYGAPSSGNCMWNTDNLQTFSNNPSSSAYPSTGRRYTPNTGNPVQNSTSSQGNTSNTTSGYSEKENSSRTTNMRDGWTGKSLEGSAVKEPDPLDMSEEAKAERWFRRAAQIKDISELSQIPDEDFPSIMPMRKGVNRFVISKRKTPLERRLTSPQYRRNLPIVSSEPLKKENDSS